MSSGLLYMLQCKIFGMEILHCIYKMLHNFRFQSLHFKENHGIVFISKHSSISEYLTLIRSRIQTQIQLNMENRV